MLLGTGVMVMVEGVLVILTLVQVTAVTVSYL